MIIKQGHADIFFLDWEPNNQKGKTVSVWRTILVANEWNELSTVRRMSIEFTLFWLGFFLLGLGLEYNATMQPNLNDTTPDTLNIVLRFANTTWWWLILSCIQVNSWFNLSVIFFFFFFNFTVSFIYIIYISFISYYFSFSHYFIFVFVFSGCGKHF